MNGFSYQFNVNEVKRGHLATARFADGKEFSGIVSQVSSDAVSIIHLGENDVVPQALTILIAQVKSGNVALSFSAHLYEQTEPRQKSERAAPNSDFSDAEKTDSSRKFAFDKLSKIKNLANLHALAKLVCDEDPRTIALVASFLTKPSSSYFLYILPSELFAKVSKYIDNMKDIGPEILKNIEKSLGDKISAKDLEDLLSQKQEESQTGKAENAKANFDAFTGMPPFGGDVNEQLSKITEIFGSLFENFNKNSGGQFNLNDFFNFGDEDDDQPKRH